MSLEIIGSLETEQFSEKLINELRRSLKYEEDADIMNRVIEIITEKQLELEEVLDAEVLDKVYAKRVKREDIPKGVKRNFKALVKHFKEKSNEGEDPEGKESSEDAESGQEDGEASGAGEDCADGFDE